MAKGLAMAYHNLSTMLDAGVPLLRSLSTVASGLESRKQKAFLALADGVSQGNPLSETMTQIPKLFGPLDVMLIEAAETSGSLPELLGLLSEWHESSRRLVRKLWSGMIYPILILTIAAFVAPIPRFILGGGTFRTYLLDVASILMLFWVPAVIIILIVRLTPETGFLRRLLDRIVLRIPGLGKAMYRLAISRYCWVFHMLCKAGVPASECAGMAVSATGNTVVANLFRPGVEKVKAGEPVCEGFSPKLPREIVEMWRVGEETGTLDDMTKRLARSNAEATEFWLNEFARWFPRFVYLLVCLFIIRMIFVLFRQMMSVSGLSGLN
jgi:type IV pilus assembly protein PilC